VLALYPPRHDGKVVGGVTTGEASISERVLRSDLYGNKLCRANPKDEPGME
jgi:hypothetical protein